MIDYLGWIGTAVMLCGAYLVGQRCRWGFVLCVFGNVSWAVIGATRGRQMDLIVVSVAFAALYVRNFIHWTRTPQ